MDDQDYSVIFPSNNSNYLYLIDKAFYKEVLLHICKNRIKSLQSPLIMSIQGKKGEGKTTHIIEICKSLDVVVIFIHGSAISGQHEKEPVELLKSAYIEASSYYEMGKNAVLLIDDIDTSVASTNSDRRYTVNSQLVNGFFMSLADNPFAIGKVKTSRVPIFFTGNDLTNIYSPLRRNGRMRIFTWEPQAGIKVQIVKHIFTSHIIESEIPEFEKIINDYIDQPISFFIDLKSETFDEIIISIIEESGEVDFFKIEERLNQIPNLRIPITTLRKYAASLSFKKITKFA